MDKEPNKELEALVEKYVKKGIPRKMAVIMARKKLKKKEGGDGSKERFKKMMQSK